jgi:hypothetical protein
MPYEPIRDRNELGLKDWKKWLEKVENENITYLGYADARHVEFCKLIVNLPSTAIL